MPPDRQEETNTTSDQRRRRERLELLETLADHLGIGAVLLRSDGEVELQTRRIDRFETILGKDWYRPCIRELNESSTLDLMDDLQHRYSFEITRLSLFRQDDVLLIRDVAASKAVERKTTDSESPASLFLDHLPAAVLIKDDQSRVLFANQYVTENFGDTHSPGADPCKLFSAEIKKGVARNDHRTLTEGRQDLVERLKDHAGKERTFRTLRFVIPRPNERSSLLGCIGWDLSDALAASESLMRGRRRYRQIFEISEEGIWLVDADADTVDVNQRMAQMLGYDIDEMRGRSLFDFMDEQAHADAEMLLDRCRSGISEKHDFRFRTKPGTDLWTMVSSAPMYDEMGAYAGVVVMVTDITERKRAEAALKRERDFAESLIETAPAIVLVLDPEGEIIRFNSFAEKLSGYPLAEVKGKSWFDTFVAERDIPQVVKAFAKARDGVQTQGGTNTILTRDGKERLIAWYLSTLQDPAGGLGTVLAIGHDVTEQKAKEAQLVQAQKMETLGQLTGGIAHDFNNLLTVILGNLELLETSLGRDSGPDLDLCDLVRDSFCAAQDGAELTKRLLAFSRKAPLKRKRIDLPAFLAHFQRFLRRTLPANVAISVDVGAELDYLPCDPHQLENALLNLALNARDAMPEGGRIHIRARSGQAVDLDPTLEPGSYAELAVIDTGTGMTPEQLSRAIEPFYTTKGSKQGSGLGLSMVFGFCEQAGGKFRLASTPGAGSRATIILPLDNADVPEGEQPPDSKGDTLAGKGTVLVVEDDERVRKLAGRYLQDLGYDILTAENGERAIEVLRSELDVELVFSDIVMPGQVNGDDLYLWVKAHRPEVKVLLTTGLRSEEVKELVGDREVTVPIGLPKPYTKEQLAEAIRDIFTG
jgi:PAS domain S-box-containing protein